MDSDELSEYIVDGLKGILDNRVDFNIKDGEIQSDIIKNLLKTLTMFAFIMVSSLFIYVASTDRDALYKKTYIYGAVIALPLIVGIYLTTIFFNKNDTISPMRFFMLALALLVISIFGYFYSTASGSSLIIVNYVISILIILIIVCGLAIFYFIFSNYLKRQTGAVGYLVNFIFYIPCLFADFVTFMKEQLGMAPSSVFLLFIIEIILIILYLFSPKLMKLLVVKNTSMILDKPIFLNTQKVLATSSTFILKDKPKDNPISSTPGNIYRNSNYCVSFWCFVNPGASSNMSYTNQSNIFNYANGKPKVVYVNDGKDHINKYIVYFTNNPNANIEQSRYELTLPLQKWNNFVFNYYDNHADLFVNGVLERTFSFINDNLPLDGNDGDTIVVGQDNGLNGAICNVNYYTTTLPAAEIINNYNILMFSPPFT